MDLILLGGAVSLVLLPVGVFAIAAFTKPPSLSDAEDARWRAAAGHLGLDLRVPAPGRRVLLGQGVRVELDTARDWFSVRVPGPSDLVLRRGVPGGRLETGDAAFDEVFTVRGDAALAQVRFDHPVRAALLRAAEAGGVELDGGTLLLRRRVKDAADPRPLVDEARFLGDALTRPLDTLGGELARAAVDDPSPGFARRALDLLRAQPDAATPWRTVAWEVVRTRTDAAVVPAAAVLADPAAHAALVRRDDLPGALRREAFAALAARDADAARRVAREVVDGVGSRVDALDPDLLDALARALVVGADEPALIDLTSVPSDRIRAPALRALAVRGTKEALETLIALRGEGPRQLRRLAAEAVDAIQARVAPGMAGQLSLADADATGGLSVAEQAGGVSLPRPPAPPGRTVAWSRVCTRTDEAALHAALGLADPAACATLVHRDDLHPSLRRLAFAALSARDPAAARRAVREILDGARDPTGTPSPSLPDLLDAFAHDLVAVADEPALLALLDLPSIRVRTRALRALAAQGTRAALEPLTALRDVGPKPLGRLAAEAIEAIRGRVAPSVSGQLTLTGDDVGGLSLPRADGSLSLADDHGADPR